MQRQVRLAGSVALGALLVATGGTLAADFTVANGQTALTTQQLTDPGDAGLIELGGAISTAGDNEVGVLMGNINQSIDNRGNITTLGIAAYGIYSTGADAYIDNSGDITTAADQAYGIMSTGADAEIHNSGAITTSGETTYGIISTGADAYIDNSGDITTAASYSYGISSEGDGAQIANTGDITTSGFGALGIVSVGADAIINNSGNIRTSGTEAAGIYSHAGDVQINNSGDITTSGGSAYGIEARGANATVTNSGRVISEQSLAIFFLNDGTLNLLAGSAIQGGIRFYTAGTGTLNIGPGLNTALTFTGLPNTINTYGAPTVIQGSLVAVVDPTGLSAQDELLTDLSRAIADTLEGRLGSGRVDAAPVAGAELEHRSGGLWATGIGSYRRQAAEGIDFGFASGLGGLMLGYDGEVSDGTRIGGFVGAAASTFQTEGNSQQIDGASYFGGLYAGFTGEGYFLDLSVAGGVSRQSSDRAVANNLVIGGIEHATADYGGSFINPSATIGTSFALESGGMLIPSLRASYAGLFLDGYEESGSAADLAVDGRNVNVLDLRAQLALALAPTATEDGSMQTVFRLGADGSLADNADVDATLLGEDLNFSVSGGDTLRGFVGADLSYVTDAGSTFFLGAEAGYDSSAAFTLDARAGLQIPL